MALSWPYKDKDEKLDYVIDWSARLDTGDAIAASSWSISAGDGALTIGTSSDAPSFTDTRTTVWLLGGTVGVRYSLTNTITTDAGRIMEQTATLLIKEK